jgi:catecholate siderophore receptor
MKNKSLGGVQKSRRPRRRRRGTSRLFVLGTAFMAATVAGGVTPAYAQQIVRDAQTTSRTGAASSDQIRRFDIAPGTIASVSDRFQIITGIRVVLAKDVGDLPSPGVVGTLTAVQALEKLLAGTGIGYMFTDASTVALDVRASEFVAVEGHGPTVASPKFTQPLRDIPQTIAIIPKETIQAQGATTLRDVLRNVPGITFQAGEGGGELPGDSFTLRGFSASNDLFIDGVRDSGGYSRDAFNIEQVEVAKGPSSSIAGRGATGGAINQVTKSPTMQPDGAASVGVGGADYRRGTLDVNQPFGAPTIGAAFRLNAMWTESGVPGRDVVENRSWAVAPSLAAGLGSPTQLVLKYQHVTQDNVPDYGLPWGNSPGFPTGAFRSTPPIDQSNFYGLRDYDFEDISSHVATGEVSHRFSGTLSLRNLTRYSRTDRDSAITSPRPPNRQLQRRTMGNDNVANQTNLTASIDTGSVRHDMVSGIEFSRETTSNQNSAQTTNQPQVSITDPNPGDRPFGPMPANTGNPSDTTLHQAGAYVFDTVNIGARWQFTGGARFDIVDVDYALTTLATREVSTIQNSDSMLSWKSGVVYKPRPMGSVYLGYGTSFNPSVDAAATGAALSTTPTAANNPNLAPEETHNYEAGTKWDVLGNRLSLTGAVFRTEKVNARTRNANSDPFILAGKQRVDGVELGVSGNITNRWSALAAYSFMHSRIDASANAAEEGMNLALTPENAFNLWTSFALPREVTVGGGVQYMDAVFRNTTSTTVVPSYWLVNGLASYAVNEKLTLRLNGQNLADTQYVDRVGGGHYIPGPRRQVLLNLDVHF